MNFKNSDTGLPIRPEFSCVQEMNETIIQRWNEVVRPGDKVYHLGDVFMGPKEWFTSMWPRLMGSKRLIVGNHDDIKFLAGGGFFQKVQMWRRFDEFGLLLTHVPVHESSLLRFRHQTNNLESLKCVHGHIHEKASPKGLYQNVCVERNNYYPINIDEIRIR